MKDQKQIKSLIDNIYYQKLGAIVSKISEWRIKKDQYFQASFLRISQHLAQSLNQKQSSIKSQCLVLEEILAEMKVMLSKFKVDPKNTVSVNQNMKNKQGIVTALRSQWNNKKSKLTQLYNFSYTFNAVLNKQLTNIQKNCNTVYNLQKKIQNLPNTFQSKFANKTHMMSIKNNKKYFQLSKTQQISKLYSEQITTYTQMFVDIQQSYQNTLDSIIVMLHNAATNLHDLGKLYYICFGQKISEQIVDKLIQLKKVYEFQIKQFNNLRKKRDQSVLNKCQLFLKQFESLVWKTIQEISIASWDIQYRFSSSSSNQTQQAQTQYKTTKGILTMDNKFMIVQSQNNIFGKQFSLIQSNIRILSESTSKSKKMKNMELSEQISQIVIKSKKKQWKIFIRFESQQRMDQFMLHVNKARNGKII